MLQSFLTVGQQIVTLYLLMVVGFVLGKVKLLDDRGSVALSSLVMYVVSPCMMVVAFQRPLERAAAGAGDRPVHVLDAQQRRRPRVCQRHAGG